MPAAAMPQRPEPAPALAKAAKATQQHPATPVNIDDGYWAGLLYRGSLYLEKVAGSVTLSFNEMDRLAASATDTAASSAVALVDMDLVRGTSMRIRYTATRCRPAPPRSPSADLAAQPARNHLALRCREQGVTIGSAGSAHGL